MSIIIKKGVTKKKPVAIFDIDGTIFRKNLQFELLDGLSWKGIFSREARNKLVKYYRGWLENKSSYEAYRELLVSLYKKNIKKCSQKDVFLAARDVADFHHGRVFIYTSKLLEKLKKTHVTIAISGSPIEIVREFNRYLKFNQVFGTVFSLNKNGFYTGKEEFSPVLNKGKVVKSIILNEEFTLKNSYGIGDTTSDISFLKIVEHPIAFNPDLLLKRAAERNRWKIIVERKDVIYEIRE